MEGSVKLISNFVSANILWYFILAFIHFDLNILDWWIIQNVFGRILLTLLELSIIFTSLKTIEEEQERDRALYFVEDGEKGFSPEYNNMVIKRTMEKAKKMRLKKQKEYDEAIGERADAVATYLKSRVAEGNSPIEKYFGKKTMAQLRGIS